MYCSVVLDVFSRRTVGWSIDHLGHLGVGHLGPRYGHPQPVNPTRERLYTLIRAATSPCWASGDRAR